MSSLRRAHGTPHHRAARAEECRLCSNPLRCFAMLTTILASGCPLNVKEQGGPVSCRLFVLQATLQVAFFQIKHAVGLLGAAPNFLASRSLASSLRTHSGHYGCH
jgi:hypothetical protein